MTVPPRETPNKPHPKTNSLLIPYPKEETAENPNEQTTPQNKQFAHPLPQGRNCWKPKWTNHKWTNHTPKQTVCSSPTPRKKLLKTQMNKPQMNKPHPKTNSSLIPYPKEETAENPTQMKKYHRNWSDHKLVKSKFYNKSSSLVFNISPLSKPCTHRWCLTLICTRKSLKCSLKALKSWSKLKRPSMNSLICGLQINKQHNW